jgi:DNA-binding NtrC family response regulator
MSKKFKILIIDDDDSVREGLARIFSTDYDTFSARDGREAIALMKQTHPDLITLDIKMPGIDGFKLLKVLKTIDEKLPIIIISAIGSLKTMVDIIKLGANDCFDKPFDIRELKDVIDKSMNEAASTKKRNSQVLPLDIRKFIINEVDKIAGYNTGLKQALQSFRETYIDLIFEKALKTIKTI